MSQIKVTKEPSLLMKQTGSNVLNIFHGTRTIFDWSSDEEEEDDEHSQFWPLRTWKTANGHSSQFKQEDNEKLAKYIIDHKALPNSRKKWATGKPKTEAELKETINLYQQWVTRRNAHREALKNKNSKPKNDTRQEERVHKRFLERNEECIDGFTNFERYIFEKTNLTMLDLHKKQRNSPWWKDNIIPLLDEDAKVDEVEEEEKLSEFNNMSDEEIRNFAS